MGNLLRRWWKPALLLTPLVLGAAIIWGVLGTTAGARWTLGQAVGILSRTTEVALRLGEVHGSIWGGLHLAECSGRLPGQRCAFRLASVSLQILPWPTLQRGLTVEHLACDRIEMTGPPPATWVTRVPAPPFECLALPGGLPEIRSLRVGTIDWCPEASSPLHVRLDDLVLARAMGSGASSAARLGAGVLTVLERPVARAKLNGAWTPSAMAVEGTIEGTVLGQPFASEVRVSSHPQGACPVSGRLLPLTLDLASFSRWLCPLWQDHLPLALEGRLSGEGSWAYSPQMGLLANLSGELRQGRVVAVGLFWSILEMNLGWKLFDGRLALTDLGSTFLGAAAHLDGEVAWPPGAGTEWNLHFEVPSAPVEQVLAGMPWMVRIGFRLPELAGLASLSCRLTGTTPQITGTLEGTDLRLAWPGGGEARFRGSAAFRQTQPGDGRWRLTFGWTAAQPPRGLFSALRLDHETLEGRVTGPVELRATLVGPTLDDLQMRARVDSPAGTFGLAGIWAGGGWNHLHFRPGVPAGWEDEPGGEPLAPPSPDAGPSGAPVIVTDLSLRELAWPQGR